MTGWVSDVAYALAAAMRTCTMSSVPRPRPTAGRGHHPDEGTRGPLCPNRHVFVDSAALDAPSSHRSLSAKLLRAGEGSRRQSGAALTRSSSVPARRRRTSCAGCVLEISLKQAGRLGTRQRGPSVPGRTVGARVARFEPGHIRRSFARCVALHARRLPHPDRMTSIEHRSNQRRAARSMPPGRSDPPAGLRAPS